MAIKINFDSACIPEKPTLILATRSGNFLGQLLAEEIVVHDAMNESPEISFSVKKYKDNNSMDYLWDSIQDFKLVWCKEWDMWFEIAVELEESNSIQKKVSATNLGIAELSQLMVYTTEINTENDIARDDYELPTVFYNEENIFFVIKYSGQFIVISRYVILCIYFSRINHKLRKFCYS